MARWYRAYPGTVTDPKLSEVALIVGCSRSVAIAAWHCILESAAETDAGGAFVVTPRRVAAILGEPLGVVEAVFAGLVELSMISGDVVCAWVSRQYESDGSAARMRRHRERSRASPERRSDGEVTSPERHGDGDVTSPIVTVTPPENRVQIQNKNTPPDGGECLDEDVETPEPVGNTPYATIVGAFNSICPTLPKVQTIAEHRKRAMRARWLEDPGRQSSEWWREYFGIVARSPFLLGSNDRAWRADFDWLLKPSNMVKVSEGKYLESGVPETPADAARRRLREWATGGQRGQEPVRGDLESVGRVLRENAG